MKTLARLSVAAGFAAVSLSASLASAHVRLVYPTPRYPSPTGMDDSSNIKGPPCGPQSGGTRTTDMSRITVLEPGATIMVQFNETINHPGFFRISFDDDGQDAFVAPTMRSQIDTAAPFTLPVLLDNIPDHAAGAYTAMVTLPNVECERCTLQLIQVMVNSTAMSWGAGYDEDIYFTCADIVLHRGGGGGGMGAGGMAAGGMGTGGIAPGGFGGVAGTGGGVDFGGMGPGDAGGTGASAGTGTATGGAPTGGVTGGGAPSGGVGGATATGGTTTGAGAPAGGTAPNGGTTTFTPANTEEEGGCRMAPTSKGGHAFWATALLAFGVAVRRRRGSRSVAA
jgi:hypothetical protein